MKLTVDILKDIIQGLSFDIPIIRANSIGKDINDLESWQIDVCKTYWLTAGCNIAFGLNPNLYKINGISNDNYIVLKETIPFQGYPVELSLSKLFPVAPFFYKHGTAIDTNVELSLVPDAEDKFPMVYLLEPFRETISNDSESAINRKSSLTIFFLQNFNVTDWQTEDHYKEVIQAMNNGADSLLEYFGTPGKGFGLIDSHIRINHVNLSIQKTLKGQETQIFSDYLSGCEIRIELPIKNNCVNLAC